MHRVSLYIASLVLTCVGSVQVQADAVADADAAENLYQLGLMNQGRGRYQEAESQHLQALQIREAAQPADDLAIAESVMALGAMYRNRGWYAQAEPFLQRGIGHGIAAVFHDDGFTVEALDVRQRFGQYLGFNGGADGTR